MTRTAHLGLGIGQSGRNHMKVIDTISDITPKTALALKHQGVRAVFGYLGHWSKCLTPSRVKVLQDATLPIGFFFEGGGRTFSAAQGYADANEAIHYAALLGVPRGVGIGICPAVDYDAQPADYPAIRAHWRSWRRVLGSDFRLGMYAGEHVLEALKDEYDYSIEPSAWGGHHIPGIAMYQNSVSTTLCGIGVDIDELYDASILWGGEDLTQTKVIVNGVEYPAVVVNGDTYIKWTALQELPGFSKENVKNEWHFTVKG